MIRSYNSTMIIPRLYIYSLSHSISYSNISFLDCFVEIARASCKIIMEFLGYVLDGSLWNSEYVK